MDLVAVNIDGKGKLGNIAVVNAPGFDIVAFGPFHKMFDVFAQAVGKGVNVGHGFIRPELSIGKGVDFNALDVFLLDCYP